MWSWIFSWLSSFWKTAEDIDPIEADQHELDEVPLDKNFRELPSHFFHDTYDAEFTQHSGFHVPMNYRGRDVVDEVEETRVHGSIYDASYKRQFHLFGKDSSKFLDALVTSDIESLEEGMSVETLMTNNNGGIIDILVVSKRFKEGLHIVANNPKVLTEVQNHLERFQGDVTFNTDGNEYFIFQGPKCATYLKRFFPDIESLPPMCCKETRWYFSSFLIRNADTEEDGYSISSEELWLLVGQFRDYFDEMPLIGFAAKECLRIEAGRCLSGCDINEQTTPVEAELKHLISERKREFGGFPGSERILNELKSQPNKRRRGFFSKEGRLRKGDIIFSSSGQRIGYVTSGAYSKIAKGFIAMGYVDATYCNKTDDLVFNGRIKGRFHRMPFVRRGETR